MIIISDACTKEALLKGKYLKVDLLVLSSFNQLLFKLKLNFLFLQNNLS
jgi:hypothetical protein